MRDHNGRSYEVSDDVKAIHAKWRRLEHAARVPTLRKLSGGTAALEALGAEYGEGVDLENGDREWTGVDPDGTAFRYALKTPESRRIEALAEARRLVKLAGDDLDLAIRLAARLAYAPRRPWEPAPAQSVDRASNALLDKLDALETCEGGRLEAASYKVNPKEIRALSDGARAWFRRSMSGSWVRAARKAAAAKPAAVKAPAVKPVRAKPVLVASQSAVSDASPAPALPGPVNRIRQLHAEAVALLDQPATVLRTRRLLAIERELHAARPVDRQAA